MADISQVKLPNGDTYNLVDETSGYIKSYTETDPVFSASAAAGITSTDISNWNGKSSTDEKLKTIISSSNNTSYYPIFGTNNTGSASTKFIDTTSFMYYKDGTYTYLALGSSTTGAGSIILRNINNVDTTIKCSATTTGKTITFPNASGTVALTSDIPSKTSDLTNDSGFITSYTDEKLGLSLVSSPATYHPILTQDTTTAGKKSYDNDGFIYYNYSGTTSAVGNAKLTLGNNKTATTAKNKQGTLELYGSTAYAIRITAGAPTVIRNIEFPNKDGTIALTSDIPTVPTKVSDLTNDSGFISSYTETDPVFSASAAAGITATDISNWNAKVSDDKTWNGVTLNKAYMNNKSSTIVPIFESGAAYYYIATATPSGGKVVLYDNNAYLNSTTPSANDNSTKVATTAYVDSAVGGITVPTKTSELTNDSGFITTDSDEKVKQTPIGDSNSANYGLVVAYNNGGTETTNFVRSTNRIYINNSTPSIIVGKGTDTQRLAIRPDRISFIYNSGNHQGYLMANSITGNDKIWTLPDKTGTIALTSDIPSVYSSTNTGGYLTMATLPIYDGTVE